MRRIKRIVVVAVCAFAALTGAWAGTAAAADHASTQHDVAGPPPPGFGWD